MIWLTLATACSEYEVVEQDRQDVFLLEKAQTAQDLLFVIDDSASMTEEQSRLTANVDTFVEAVADSEISWRLAVTTTDVSTAAAGSFTTQVIDDDSADLANLIRAAMDVGTAGDRDEQGLAAALAALQRNPSFARADARMNVVILSDEDDHSPGHVPDYLADLDELGGMGLHVHVIVGDAPSGCANGQSAADAGIRYLTAAADTQGYYESICADSYAGILTRLGLDVAGIQDTFELTEVPQAETLQVFVDDVVIPALSEARDVDAWRYDPGDNAVVFEGRSIPRPGQTVVVSYQQLVGGQTSAVDTGG